MKTKPAFPFQSNKLLLATANQGKVRELRGLLSEVSIELTDLNSLPWITPVEETGSTFRENAELKATTYAAAAGMYAVADDSGLEIEALGGRPGIYSARYGGENLSDADRIDLILEELLDIPAEKRAARFVASIALAAPEGSLVFTCEGECRGSIAFEPLGTLGFGYDPIFIPDGFTDTFGQLPEEVKRDISHRSRAISIFVRFLLDFSGV